MIEHAVDDAYLGDEQAALDARGAEGWELVAVVRFTDGFGAICLRLYFKRIVQ